MMGRELTGGIPTKEYMRAYYLKNRERAREQQQARYAARREEILAQQREYARANSEKIAAKNRTEAGRAKWRRYDAANREQRRLKAAARRAANPGLAYQRTKAYVERHPETKKQWDARRRARKSGAEGAHTFAQWEAKKKEYDYRCAYCGEKGPLHRDHDVPLCRGGSDFIENIVPACRSCNSRKGRSTRAEFEGRA